MDAICDDLQRRIEAGKNWIKERRESEFRGPKVRGYPSTVRLFDFLESTQRVERFGVGFIVTVHGDKANKSFQLNVRIKPYCSEGPKETSTPYVVVYVQNQRKSAEDLIICEHLTDASSYAKIVELSDEDWYKLWLERALQRERGKFFEPENLID